ncbi:MAG: Lrp/AsnC family transcriptional regulator [Candidatus Syntrophoarchaeum sp.]|nr:Lrp/AsnC family transcriptional regulator [Candidatus Syntrophoarchaeum sp.]
MNELQKKILNELQIGLQVVERPFLELSKRLGVDEDVVISEIRSLINDGYIRRVGPIIDATALGMVGTLAAISVPEEELYRVATYINSFDEVSHNYLRVAEGIPYNLWFTVSAKDRDDLDEILDEIRTGINYPLIELPTRRLFKIGVEFRL